MKNTNKNAQRPYWALFLFPFKLFQKLFLNFQSSIPVWSYSGLIIIIFTILYPPTSYSKKSYPFSKRESKTTCFLQKVIDGDTVIAICDKRHLHIRLQGIDAPESLQYPWGKQSTLALQKYLPNKFYLQPTGIDKYKRQLGILYNQNHENINLKMVKTGWAFAYRYKNTEKKYKECRKIC
ncbi:thermonuclease family protein [Suttonella ornithocola]|uniref:thermonuclease family protein n=1 Tax=Suttonella ornithocola TaxID=279832 RepID=UPI0009352BBF|nr:thermonuclease family protein [Suttonella ornithocola]